MEQGFKDRRSAGRSLARLLAGYSGRGDVVVLGLPRGGMQVAFAIAESLRAPLDALLVGKIGAPGQPELALGAVSDDGTREFNGELLAQCGFLEEELEGAARHKIAELQRKSALYRQGSPAVPVSGKVVILVDDGMATGATMRAAIRTIRRSAPRRLVVALPVASPEALASLEGMADELFCPLVPEPFLSVGEWYGDFSPVGDEEVISCLEASHDWRGRSGRRTAASADGDETRSVRVAAGGVALPAELVVPRECVGLILFAHGSGSSRLSSRNRRVAGFLNEAGFATLLMDLLTREEDDSEAAGYRFDVELLSDRLLGAIRWARTEPALARLRFGLFGASTGAAAALVAAARSPHEVRAVVSRGGRPDLAGEALEDVVAPTLLIVGGEDEDVLELNRHSLAMLHGTRKLEIIPGATHLFEEPGALEQVAELAREWFEIHLMVLRPEAALQEGGREAGHPGEAA